MDPGFKTPADLDGLFSGFDRGQAEPTTSRPGSYQLDGEGYPKQRQDAAGSELRVPAPAAALPPLHAGDGREGLRDPEGPSSCKVADIFCSASGPDKTGTDLLRAPAQPVDERGPADPRALHAAAHPRQHRAAGRRRGGAARPLERPGGHGLRDALPHAAGLSGRCRSRRPTPTLTDYLEKTTPKGGYWVNKPKFVVSLLKAWWGDAATKDNDYAYDYLPKREKADAYSPPALHGRAWSRSKVTGLHLPGPEPGGGQPQRQAWSAGGMRNLEWLVVVDIFETETAAVWKAPGVDPKSCQTEVFFIPAAPAAEKDGSLTNTMRLVQWHVKAVEPPGDVAVRRGVHRRPRQPAQGALHRLHAPRRTGPSSTSSGTTSPRARRRSRRWSWCSRRSTATRPSDIPDKDKPGEIALQDAASR